MRIERQTVNLGEYPDLVVLYLGMRVRRPTGLLRMVGLGPQIQRSWKDRPDGLLLHEDVIWSLIPPHVGMRQYWRDLDSLERWTRSEPHRRWWLDFMRDGGGGTGFWHEAYFMRGGMEAIYDGMPAIGLGKFAPRVPARGRMFSARRRAGHGDEPVVVPVIPESELYDPAEDATVTPAG